jgi:hypothetical protein
MIFVLLILAAGVCLCIELYGSRTARSHHSVPHSPWANTASSRARETP